MNNDGINSKIKIGLKWNLINQVMSQLIFVWFSIYLARLLGPQAYGLVGMVTVLAGFANLFIDFGFTSSIIYFQVDSPKQLSSVFWFNLFMGLLIYVGFYTAAPFIADFYNEPDLVLLTRVICIGIIISSLTSLQGSLLSKEINFRKKVIVQWISTVVSYSVGFYLAFEGYGVWSIVFMTLTSNSINSLILWFTSKWKPLLYFSYKELKSLFKYSLSIGANNIFVYLTRNLDNFIIAKFLGDKSLGLYSNGYRLMMLPVTNVAGIFTNVLFAGFSKMDNKEKIASTYLKVVKLIAFITFPLMVGLFSVAEEFVKVMYGPAWSDLIPIIKVLSLLGAIQSILFLNGTIFNVIGKPKESLVVTIILNVVLVIAWGVGLKVNGILGFVSAYFIVGSLGSIFILRYAISFIELNLLAVFKVLKAPLIGAILMGAVIFVVKDLMNNECDVKWILFILIAIGALFYCAYSYFFIKDCISIIVRLKK